MGYPLPTLCGVSLFFPNLANTENLNGVLALAWRFEDVSSDVWTNRVIRFKSDDKECVRAFSLLLPAAMKRLDLDFRNLQLVSAISSKDEELREGSPLYTLSASLSERLGIRWNPRTARKSVHKSLHSIKGSAERDAEVHLRYEIVAPITARDVIIVDDLTTRGSTMNDIARAVRIANPKVQTIYGVSLAKNERIRWATEHNHELSNAHLPEPWNNFFKIKN